MSEQELMPDPAYAKAFAQVFSQQAKDLDWYGLGGDGDTDVNAAQTFLEAGLTISPDSSTAGVVLYMSDGAQVRLTINAYTPAGAR